MVPALLMKGSTCPEQWSQMQSLSCPSLLRLVLSENEQYTV